MTALTADNNVNLNGGDVSGLRLQASEIPFAGSPLVFAADGYVETLDSSSAGQPFAGHNELRVIPADHPTTPADGDLTARVRRGQYGIRVPISGSALDDAAIGRAVFASDDGTYDFTPSGTLIGRIVAIESSGIAIVAVATQGYEGSLGLRARGLRTMAATGNQTLGTADLGKLIVVPNTGALELALPPAADCTCRGFIVKKTTADAAAITLNPDGAETIDGGATFAAIDANNDFVEIISTGAAWLIIARNIA